MDPVADRGGPGGVDEYRDQLAELALAVTLCEPQKHLLADPQACRRLMDVLMASLVMLQQPRPVVIVRCTFTKSETLPVYPGPSPVPPAPSDRKPAEKSRAADPSSGPVPTCCDESPWWQLDDAEMARRDGWAVE